MKPPKIIETMADLFGVFFKEKGNKKITGQHGDVPFILSQSGVDITNIGKQIKVKKINIFFLFLIIFYQNLHPIDSFWRCS